VPERSVVDDVRTEIMRNRGVYVPELAVGGRLP